MKKLASILGIGMVSMAVALAPAFAQQTQPQGNAGSTTVQPKSDVKTPAGDQAGKDVKNMQVKPGANLKSDKPVKSTSTKAMHKHHAKKSSGKVASRMHAKTHASNLDKSKTGK